MKSLSAVLMILLLLIGCSTLRTEVVKPAITEDLAWVKLIQTSAGQYSVKDRPDCVAGFITAMNFVSYSGPSTRMIADAMNADAKQDSEAYKGCYSLGLLMRYQIEEAKNQYEKTIPSLVSWITSLVNP